MNVSIINILIPALAGVIGILIGSFKPIIDWRIHANKMRYDERKIFLSKVRSVIMANDFESKVFIHSIEYSQLRPYLSETFKRILEVVFRDNPAPPMPTDQYKSYGIRNTDKAMFLDEIARLEKEWKLL